MQGKKLTQGLLLGGCTKKSSIWVTTEVSGESH